MGAYLCRKVLLVHPGEWLKKQIFNWMKIKEMIAVNQNLFLRTMSLLFVFAFFTHQGAGQGDDILAANAILKNFYLLMALALDGFAIAAEALVGEAIGKKDHKRFWLSVTIAMKWGFIFSLIYTLIYLLLGDYIIRSMTSISNVIEAANIYLIWTILTPILSFACFIWDGVFVGARKAAEMRNSMIISTFFVFLPVWYLTQQLDNHGLWFAFLLFLIARSISMSLYALWLEKNNKFVWHN